MLVEQTLPSLAVENVAGVCNGGLPTSKEDVNNLNFLEQGFRKHLVLVTLIMNHFTLSSLKRMFLL